MLDVSYLGDESAFGWRRKSFSRNEAKCAGAPCRPAGVVGVIDAVHHGHVGKSKWADTVASRPHLADLVLLLGRLLLSLIFLHEGLSLAANLPATLAAFSKLGLPMPATVAVIALQLGAGLAIAAGLFARLGAIALALFCLATALLFHTSFSSQNELLHLEKDLAIAGGMFVLAISGPGSLSLGRLIRSRPIVLPAWLTALL